MARRQRKSPAANSPKPGELLDAPYNHLYTGRDADEDRLVTTLLLAGEALAEPFRKPMPPQPDAPHANPVENARPTIIEDFAELLEIVGRIRAWIEGDAHRAELLTCLREAFGDGETLKLLFRQFFPGQVSPPSRDMDGKSVLSKREVEVLREAAGDLSHEEIAARLDIAPRTVNRHFENIYRKLGVHRPLQAVARAISMGYLDMDALDILMALSHCTVRDFGTFDSTISHLGYSNAIPQSCDLRSLVEFCLLLMTASGTATDPLREDYEGSLYPLGVVCELNVQGEIVRRFGEECVSCARGIAVAPSDAAKRGFTPGNLFVVSGKKPHRGTNSGSVTEFTPEGRFVRAFYGGKDLGTRLDNPTCLVFATDGRLLVGTSGALLTFSEGGAAVRIFVNGYCHQVCTNASGQVYMIQASGIGCVGKVLDPGGQLVFTFGGTPAGIMYDGIAVNSQGHIFVARTEHERAVIEEFTDDGKFLRSFAVSGFDGGSLAIDRQDRLYVPCRRANDVKVLSLGGDLLRRIDLREKITPFSVAIGENGNLWVSGSVP